MSVPRDLRDVLYSGISLDGFVFTAEEIEKLIAQAEKIREEAARRRDRGKQDGKEEEE